MVAISSFRVSADVDIQSTEFGHFETYVQPQELDVYLF